LGRDQCRWCRKIGYYQKDCLEFLKHLNRKGEDHITFVDESLLIYAKPTRWIDSGFQFFTGIPYKEDPTKRRKNT
jgi:hypothetical protein